MSRRRLYFTVALVASWFLALALRLYQLQVLEHEHFRERAERQQNRVVTLTAPRGTIYDRRGHELAVSVEVRSAAADPSRIDDPTTTATALAEVLGWNARQRAELAADLEADKAFVWVERKLDPPLGKRIEELELPGVFLLPESKRYYPLRSLAAQVLGYVGTDNQGLWGLEFLYDPVVASDPGKRTVVRDARSGITVLNPQPETERARPGKDLHLTLDSTLQHIAESELARAVESSGARSGMVVMQDPESGAVLAMASYPTFDPNQFGQFPEASWGNRVVMDAYEPGSTFKMITLAAALEAGGLDVEQSFDCEMGAIRFGRTRINDHKPFGILTVRGIIAKSSNVGAIKLGAAAGTERFYRTIEAFGFGRPTGIDLPSESPGILRPLARWSPLSPAYISFGQGISVTALQLNNAFAAIANGGRLLEPYIVEKTSEQGGERIGGGRRQVVGYPVSPSSVAEIKELLAGVVSDEGTAESAAVLGFRVAGKTGTAQKAAETGGYAARRYVASFVGFVPVDEPTLVATVVLDEPWPRYHGGEVAAPVFAAIAERALPYLGVRPDLEMPRRWPGEPPVLQRVSRDPEKGRASDKQAMLVGAAVRRTATPPGTLPDFAGLTARQAVVHSSRLGLELELHGHGAVARQAPPPGTPLELAGQRIEIWLEGAALAANVGAASRGGRRR